MKSNEPVRPGSKRTRKANFRSTAWSNEETFESPGFSTERTLISEPEISHRGRDETKSRGALPSESGTGDGMETRGAQGREKERVRMHVA